MEKRVLIIGGGVAGMEAGARIALNGIKVTLVEKKNQLGGHLINWHKLFPAKANAMEVYNYLNRGANHPNIEINFKTEVEQVVKNNAGFHVKLSNNKKIYVNAILVATGFDLFNVRIKEEYGYGIYKNVITSVELEKMFIEGYFKSEQGRNIKRVAFVHCVGSRDEKCGNLYCSKVCCITGVKQAIELKEHLNNPEIFCFYMDMRMFDMYFEELYFEAQQKHGVQFIRGRVSEVSESKTKKIIIKAEDTLIGRPLKMEADLLVLLAGMVPSAGTIKMANLLNLQVANNGFLKTLNINLFQHLTSKEGIYMAGTSSGPKTINDSLNSARSASLEILQYLDKN